jgi:hypothetical protein
VGLVSWSTQSFVGGIQHLLATANLGGKKLGPIAFVELEAGKISSYQIDDQSWKNKVLVINSKLAWKAFYKKHKAGQAVPDVDFSKKTVLAVLAGSRPNGGYGVRANLVAWDYPAKRARVTVNEYLLDGPAIQILTAPYEIVTLNEKVKSVSVDWKLVGF